MLLVIGGTQWTRVGALTNTTFQCYLNSTPAGAATITSGEDLVTAPSAFATISVSLDASLNGVPSNGYSTTDPVHCSFYCSNPSLVSSAYLRVYVNGSSTDYYQAQIFTATASVIAPQVAVLQAQISKLQQQLQQLYSQGGGNYPGYYYQVQGIEQAIQTLQSQIYVLQNQSLNTAAQWYEIDTPKSSFTAVGNAGNGPYSWKNVTGFQVVYTVSSGTPTVAISSIYIAGGYGPSAATAINSQLVPYNYVYTFYNPITGAESSPSIPLITQNCVQPNGQAVALTLYGTADSQISGSGSIKIYRQGGSFSDGYYRQVGIATNPGGGSSVIFIDNQSDASIAANFTAEFDNDPPVTSTLPTPALLSFNSWSSGTGAANAVSVVAVNVVQGPTSFIADFLTVGSVITVGRNTSYSESARVVAIDSAGVHSNTLTLFFQYNQTQLATIGGVIFECDSVIGKPLNLMCSAFDSLFAAGDTYNPQTLYQSKVGRPEAWPVVNLTTNYPAQINVGTPTDSIMAITEFRGGILCLNRSALFLVQVFAGQMQNPIQLPANRGLLAPRAWCRADNEVWFLAYDGIYSWNGSQLRWRSKDIDPLFRGQSVGPYLPVNLSVSNPSAGANLTSMAFVGQEVFFDYQDTNLNQWRLRYHIAFDRWSFEFSYDPLSTAPPYVPVTVTTQYVETESGNAYIAKTVPYAGYAYLYQDQVGYTDGWYVTPYDGSNISCQVQPGFLTLGEPFENKQLTKIQIEAGISAGLTATVQMHYDFGSADPTDTFGLAVLPRGRVPFALQGGFGKECYAASVGITGPSNVGPQGFTLYSMTLFVIDLTDIEVGGANDWDDLGYPYDKKLSQLVLTYDIQPNQTAVINMDTITGIADSLTCNDSYQTFTLTPMTGAPTGYPNRKTANFTINDGTVVKRVRIRPTVAAQYFKYFGYSFPDFSKYPADITTWTEWSDLGYPCEKTLRSLEIEINTNGVACGIQIQGDGVNLGPLLTVTTSISDRRRIVSLPSNLTAKNFRLVLTPGVGGMAQLFGYTFDKFNEPCAVDHFDTYEMTFGYDGYSFMKQVWLEYYSTSAITVAIYVAGDQLLFSTTLPAHPHRDVERFYLPAVNAGVLNKSKQHRMTVDTGSAYVFRIYKDSSRIEWMPIGSDQRSAYQQAVLSTLMAPET
jgi:hypothetical protein